MMTLINHLMDSQFEKIPTALTIIRCKKLATEYGLHLQPPLLGQLKRERHLQTPKMFYHLTSWQSVEVCL